MWRLVELIALCGLAWAAPIFDIYNGNAAELLFRDIVGLRVVVFALIVLLFPPVFLWVAELVFSRATGTSGEAPHRAVVGMLTGVAILRLFPVGPVSSWAAIVVGLLAGVVLWWVFPRSANVASWMRLMALLPVAMAVLFLASSDIARLTFPKSVSVGGGSVSGESSSVIFLILDELPTASLVDENGMIDPDRFPGLAGLAADATWFPNNMTTASWTSLSVPIIATGRYPEEALAPFGANYPENIFTLFETTHRIDRIETSTRLCPVDICGGGSGPLSAYSAMTEAAVTAWRVDTWPFSELVVDFKEVAGGVSRPDAAAEASDMVSRLIAEEGSTLAYLHIPLPHQPWSFMPSGQQYEGSTHSTEEGVWANEGTAAAGRQQHLLQLQYADSIVADLTAQLRAADRYDDVAIVLLSDHGVAFTPGAQVRAADPINFAEIAFTPLIVKAPNQSVGAVDRRPTQSIDAFPTAASIAGVSIPWEVDGVDLSGDDPLTNRERLYYPVWVDVLEASSDGSMPIRLGSFADEISLPESSDSRSLYALNSDYLLMGTPVEELEIASEIGGSVVVDVSDGFDGTPSELLPLRIEVRSQVAIDGDLAVSLNGTVGVTGAPVEEGGEWVFRALLPEELLADGPNNLEVFAVTGDVASPVLNALTVTLE